MKVRNLLLVGMFAGMSAMQAATSTGKGKSSDSIHPVYTANHIAPVEVNSEITRLFFSPVYATPKGAFSEIELGGSLESGTIQSGTSMHKLRDALKNDGPVVLTFELESAAQNKGLNARIRGFSGTDVIFDEYHNNIHNSQSNADNVLLPGSATLGHMNMTIQVTGGAKGAPKGNKEGMFTLSDGNDSKSAAVLLYTVPQNLGGPAAALNLSALITNNLEATVQNLAGAASALKKKKITKAQVISALKTVYPTPSDLAEQLYSQAGLDLKDPNPNTGKHHHAKNPPNNDDLNGNPPPPPPPAPPTGTSPKAPAKHSVGYWLAQGKTMPEARRLAAGV